MKRRGLLLLLTASGLFIVGDVTRTGWVQLADALLWSALLISVIVPLASGASLEVRQRLVPHNAPEGLGPPRGLGPLEGSEGALVVELRNPRPWPRFGLSLRTLLSINGAPVRVLHLVVPYLAPGARLTVEGPITFERRGRYLLGEMTVESDAPFGLFRRRRSCGGRGAGTLVVYPAPHAVASKGSSLAVAEALVQTIAARSGEEVLGSRPYVPGDPARDIHWRGSARVGRLLTKAYATSTSQSPVMLVGGSGVADRLLDDIARVAAGVGEEWANGGMVLQHGAESQLVDWGGLLGQLAVMTADTLPSVAESVRAVAPGSSVAAILPATDREGAQALTDAAPQLGGLWVWLLAEDGSGTRPDREAALRQAGAVVTVLESPLPSPVVQEGRA